MLIVGLIYNLYQTLEILNEVRFAVVLIHCATVSFTLAYTGIVETPFVRGFKSTENPVLILYAGTTSDYACVV